LTCFAIVAFAHFHQTNVSDIEIVIWDHISHDFMALQTTLIDSVASELKNSFTGKSFRDTFNQTLGRIDGIMCVFDATEPQLKSAKAVAEVSCFFDILFMHYT
jgi:hypothetical protein